MALEKLVNYIKYHGFDAKIVNNKLFVLEIYTKNSVLYNEWVELEADYTSVRNWLGY